jgi:hypothetical protein
MTVSLYDVSVYFHVLLFVFWLGADMGVAVLGHHFRRQSYDRETRLVLLQILGAVDMFPRTAWALMVPTSLSLLTLGGYWNLDKIWLIAIWALGGFWTWIVWQIHLREGPSARLKRIDVILKWSLAAFYIGLGTGSLIFDAPLVQNWLALKAVVFGLIFAAAIMIDVRFRPLVPVLHEFVALETSATPNADVEKRMLTIMNRTRFWVRLVYALLLITAFLGSVKPL